MGASGLPSMSYPDIVDLRESGVLQDVAAFSAIALSYESGGQTDEIRGDLVTGNFFDVLGVRLERGRAFLPAEDRRGSPVRVAVVSHAFWQNRLNADASVVGKSITLNGSALYSRWRRAAAVRRRGGRSRAGCLGAHGAAAGGAAADCRSAQVARQLRPARHA